MGRNFDGEKFEKLGQHAFLAWQYSSGSLLKHCRAWLELSARERNAWIDSARAVVRAVENEAARRQ